MNESGRDALPDHVRSPSRTIDGAEFDAATWHWRFPTADGNVVFNFSNLPAATSDFRAQVREAFAVLLLANAPERLRRSLGRLRSLLRYLALEHPTRRIEEISAADVRNYGASLAADQLYLLRPLRSILLNWARTGVGGLTRDLIDDLPSMKTVGHKVGVAVRTMDPSAGPLTDLEYESFVAALRQAFVTGKTSLSDYALLVLAVSLGCRSMQLAMMKIGDLDIARRSDGSKAYMLQVTRLKQGKNIRPRTLFRVRELAPAVGRLLESQIALVERWAERNNLPLVDAPLFPSTKTAWHGRRIMPGALEGHYSGRGLASKIARLLNSLHVISPRTGEPMKLFQTRIRRTLGTRAAAEGLDTPVIADLLDHSWIDSSLVYIECRPAMIQRIDKALALRIAPLAQAFAGQLAERSSNDADGQGRVLHIPGKSSLHPIGRCGKSSSCWLAAPLACYTCPYFNPWRDDVHQLLLDRLLRERDELLASSDLRIASVNDRTILAVAEVVNRCLESSCGSGA
ncbi:Phage integrase family protein [Caballeronia temeraria]|uniref:Phage integrase family protein n=1 Tax=Caballeronia temeraria TaxID=1777137 RepID=A0A158DUQ1_9BURK|nr:site-specific integrase [Caballeronia temeraria]SAK98379.1 Phage integrase family protein [Caballeronia temeraria]